MKTGRVTLKLRSWTGTFGTNKVTDKILAASHLRARRSEDDFFPFAAFPRETNLKRKQALEETCKLTEDNQLQEFEGRIQCEAPNEHMHTFEGRMEITSNLDKLKERKPTDALVTGVASLEPSTTASGAIELLHVRHVDEPNAKEGSTKNDSESRRHSVSSEVRRSSSLRRRRSSHHGTKASLAPATSRQSMTKGSRGGAGGMTFPLTNNQVLLRGSLVRNTEWAYALVVYAGVDTKIMK
jgi:hypothetical protein